MGLSEKREETISALDTSLTEAGGADIFNKISATHLLFSFTQFKDEIRNMTIKSAFPKDGKINEEALLRSANNKALAAWLGTAVDILERAANQIQGAMDLESQICSADVENRTLLKEKVDDQKTIIQLQSQLIEKKKDDVQSFKETVQEEVKSYADMVTTSCANALAPRKLETAVKKIKESEDRSRNLMIHGLAEENNENLKGKVAGIFTHLEEKSLFSIPCRVGTPANGHVRPVKVSLTSANMVSVLLTKSRKLRQLDIYKTVYISPDRTKEERSARRTLVNELKEKRKDKPDSTFVIRNGKVLCV